jgi:putrescine aminotransferase
MVADRQTREPMGWTEVAMLAGAVRRKHGVIIRPYGHNLVLAPPLVIEERQVHRATEAVIDVLAHGGVQ